MYIAGSDMNKLVEYYGITRNLQNRPGTILMIIKMDAKNNSDTI